MIAVPARAPAKVAALILAGGRGTRMGAAVPKPLLRLGEWTLLEHVLARLGAETAPVLLSDIVTELLQKQNRADVALASIPYATAFKVAGNLERLHRVTVGRPRLTRYAVSQLGLERTLNLDAARERLGYRPVATTLDGAERW